MALSRSSRTRTWSCPDAPGRRAPNQWSSPTRSGGAWTIVAALEFRPGLVVSEHGARDLCEASCGRVESRPSGEIATSDGLFLFEVLSLCRHALAGKWGIGLTDRA